MKLIWAISKEVIAKKKELKRNNKILLIIMNKICVIQFPKCLINLYIEKYVDNFDFWSKFQVFKIILTKGFIKPINCKINKLQYIQVL